MAKNIILLINTGTPDKPEVPQVRRYLSEFLNDKRVIDLPWLLRKILVNLIIVPFRAPKSTKLYKKLWTPKGSPLLYNLINLANKVQSRVSKDYQVVGAMRYGNPSLQSVLAGIKAQSPEQIVVFPLFPHYASATTGSIHEYVLNEVKSWNVIPEIRFVGQFYSNPAFIDAFVKQIRKYEPQTYDHIVFSYHGLPMRQIQKVHPDQDCYQCKCSDEFPQHGGFCYKATCYETSRLLAAKLELPAEKFSTSFQSRLSKNWLTPFTDSTLRKLAHSGSKRVLVVAPAFVADCLETLVEIGDEYQQLFKEEGGAELLLVESLNDKDDWADAIIKIINI